MADLGPGTGQAGNGQLLALTGSYQTINTVPASKAHKVDVYAHNNDTIERAVSLRVDGAGGVITRPIPAGSSRKIYTGTVGSSGIVEVLQVAGTTCVAWAEYREFNE